MKTLIFLFAILIQSSAFAKELTVFVIEGWKSKPLAGCQVTLKSRVGQVLEELETDSLGIAIFSNLSYGYHSVEVKDAKGNFDTYSTSFKYRRNLDLRICLAPSWTFERMQMALEDSIYGAVESRPKDSEDEKKIEREDEHAQENKEPGLDTNDVLASYPGGMYELRKFISLNLIYPEISRELGDQGRVYVEFVIEPDGVVTHVKIMRGFSKELDEEAKRLIRMLPNWSPGIVNGKTVRTRCRLPVTFTLQ